MESARRHALSRVVLFIDGLLIAGSMLAAYGIHHALRPYVSLLKQPPELKTYAMLGIVAVPLWVVLLSGWRLHQLFGRRWRPSSLLIALVKVHAVGLLILSVVIFVSDYDRLNRSLVGLFLLVTFLVIYFERLLVLSWIALQHRSGQTRQRILLIGDRSTLMERFVAESQRSPHPPELVGLLTPTAVEGAESDLPPVRGDVSEIGSLLHEEPVDWVLLFPPFRDAAVAAPLLLRCEEIGVPAALAVELTQPGLAAPQIVALHDTPFIAFRLAQRPTEALAVKSLLDLIAAALGVVVLAPLLLMIALLLLVTSGRPVLFAQWRSGLHGRRFRMLKFRTMVRDAASRREELAAINEMDGPVFKSKDDPRITRLGRILRRLSLDELPQLLNVLAGSMSLVGPRPLPVEEQQRIRGAERRRLSMKPGITGLWQVSGRSDLSFEDWMRLDLRYVDSWSLGLDARILLKTLVVVFTARGAR